MVQKNTVELSKIFTFPSLSSQHLWNI